MAPKKGKTHAGTRTRTFGHIAQLRHTHARLDRASRVASQSNDSCTMIRNDESDRERGGIDPFRDSKCCQVGRDGGYGIRKWGMYHV